MYQVLIVDDEPLITEGLSVMIEWEEYGFRVCGTASNGREAMEMLEAAYCHLLITDIRMPEIDGLELIRRVRESHPSLKVLIISGHNDFSYARQAMAYGVKDYLVKPIDEDELVHNLKQIRESLDEEFEVSSQLRERNHWARDNLLYELSQGISTDKTLGKLREDHGIEWGTAPFVHALFEIRGFWTMVENNVAEAKLYHYAVRNILEECIEQRGYGQIYDDGESGLGAILQLDQLTYEQIMAYLRETLARMSQLLKIEVRAGLGLPVSGAAELKSSKLQSRIALEVVTEEDQLSVYQEQGKALLALQWDSELLFTAIQDSDEEAITHSVKALVDEIRGTPMTRPVIQSLLSHLLLAGRRMMAKYQTNAMNWMEEAEKPLQEWERLEDLQQHLQAFAHTLQRAIRDSAEHKGSAAIVRKIDDYMEAHYQEDISLKLIAKHFFMNSAYLGQLFKKEKGQSFNDCLNRLRISTVTPALGQDDSKIYDIIMNAGYKNPEYFYRQFKRYEGMSFSTYHEKKRGI